MWPRARQSKSNWQPFGGEVLGVERVGIRDDFFDLGGHSLLGIQLISHLNREMHVGLVLRDLFEAPTVEGLVQRLLAARQMGSDTELPAIEPVPRDGPLPASFGQEELWLIHRSQQGPSPYMFYPAARLRGPLDEKALEQAINEVLRRHESLRTTFAEVDGRLMQTITPHEPRPLTVVDLSGLPPDQREIEVHRYAERESQQPMDLSTGPLVRIELLRLSDEEHVVLAGMHHIVYDGWSMSILGRELLTAYFAFAAGFPPPLDELPIQYADFAAWQRQRLQGDVLQDLRRYWLKQLEGLPPLELPTDRPRPPQRTTHGGDCQRQLPVKLSEALSELGRKDGATTFMTLLAAFQTLLAQQSGQEDFAVSTPAAGRLRPETEGLIGYFLNDLVLRADLSGDPTFRQLLGRVRETVLQAFEHQELPFLQLLRDVNPPRDPSRHPLIQVELVLQNTPSESLELPGLELGELENDTAAGAADLDLSLFADESEQGIHLTMAYRTDLFDKATVDGMLAQFETLLEAITADPDRQLSAFSLPDPCGHSERSEESALNAEKILHSAQDDSQLRPQSGNGLSLAPLRIGGAEPPLFCIHGLGGHVAVFLPLARGLAEGRPVYGLQGRGLDAGQQPHDRIDAMAAAYIDEIRGVQPVGPYLLAGWSLGGLIAIEAAHQLTVAGEEVSLLAMFDTHLSAADFEKLDLDDESVLRWIAPQLNLSAADLTKLPLEQQWDRIAEQAKQADGIGVVEIRRLAEVCKAHLAAAACYEPAPYLGPAILFQADKGPCDVDRRWQTLCPRLQVERVPGNHYSMLRQPDVDVLAERLDRYIVRLAAAGTAAHRRVRADVPSAAKRACRKIDDNNG